MGATEVVSLRIPRELKRRLDELGVDWRTRVREYLEELVMWEARKRAVERARALRRSIGREGTPAAEVVREIRESE